MSKQSKHLCLTSEEKDILNMALQQLDNYYDEKEAVVRKFKHYCHKYLPHGGEGYIENINVFEIEGKTLSDIKEAKQKARQLIMNLINNF